MKTLKIYNVIATLLLVLLAIWIMQLLKEITDTHEMLDLCTERYYDRVIKE